MGRSKDMWIDAVEQVGNDYVLGEIDRDTGVARLQRLGIDTHEAETMLDEAAS